MATVPATKLAKKIAIGTINNVRGGFKHGKHFDDETANKMVMKIIGIARDYITKTSETMGDSYGFGGEFMAWNMEGEKVTAPRAYLPEPAQGMLKAAIDEAAEHGHAPAIEFGFEIRLTADEEALKGYVFDVVPLIENKPSTALDSLIQGLAQLGYDGDNDPTPAEPKPETKAKAK